MERLRDLVSGLTLPKRSQHIKRWKKGERCNVLAHADDSTPLLPGKIARSPQGEQYVVDLDDGGRYYAHVSELRTP